MTEQQVRRARIDDAAEIARLATELGYPTGVAEMRSRLASLNENAEHYVAVAPAETAEHLLGWMHVEHRLSLGSGERAELMGLVVDTASRRTGVGKALLNEAERWALARGLATITVRSNAARELSHTFYAASGYARSKTQHVYSKPLASPAAARK
jgi:GNAT superfamily N-acetyltransferase